MMFYALLVLGVVLAFAFGIWCERRERDVELLVVRELTAHSMMTVSQLAGHLVGLVRLGELQAILEHLVKHRMVLALEVQSPAGPVRFYKLRPAAPCDGAWWATAAQERS